LLALTADGWQWLISRSGLFIPWKEPVDLISQEAGWTPDKVFMSGRKEKSIQLTGRALRIIDLRLSIQSLYSLRYPVTWVIYE
jgi:hypothetical protein